MSGDREAARRLIQVGAAAALSGMAVMGIELTAVRLLAPHFGDSAYVWTNVIGAILLALATGAWIGGRLAERPAGSPLSALLAAAAALVALVPLLATPIGDWLLPAELPLDAAMPALEWGSLFATIVLFAPPIWLLGAVSPGLVTRAVRGGIATGPAAGTVSALGTAGSLVGTFAATHWLVPSFGSRITLWLCAGLLLCAAGVLRRSRGLVAAASLVTLCAVVGGGWIDGPLRAAPTGQELLAERETRYQYLQVLRTPGSDGSPARIELKINEGLDSFHSLAIEGSVFASGDSRPPNAYYDYHALAPLLAGDGARPEGLRALSIGDAAGTFRRIYAAVHPGAIVDAVEIDPGVVEVGDEFFPGPKAQGAMVTGVDGRAFVELAARQWHAIHLDAYSHQVYVPAHLASTEFFAAVLERLLPGGVVACNVGGIDERDPVVQAIARTMAGVFGSAHALRIPHSRNFLLMARKQGELQPGALGALQAGRDRLSEADAEIWRAVVAIGSDVVNWQAWQRDPDAEVLCDDRPWLDELLYESYFGGQEDPGQLLDIAGNRDPGGAETEAYTASSEGRYQDVLAVVATSKVPTQYLRWIAGSARWSLRQLRSAEAEFVAGLELAPGAIDFGGTLASSLAAVRKELAVLDAAERGGQRNFALAMAACVGGLALVTLVWRRT